MIITKYRVAGNIKSRYVRKNHSTGIYEWCEQSADNLRYDIAQGTCEAEDLPEDVKKNCDEYRGAFYPVEWKV